MTGNYRHIRFEEIRGLTVCRSNHYGSVLGRIEWMARWKEYEFIPYTDTAYTVECLRDLADFVGKMNAARKEIAVARTPPNPSRSAWIDVGKRTPTTTDDVIICRIGENRWGPYAAKYFNGKWHTDEYGQMQDDYAPTHWMPFPDMPNTVIEG